MTSCRKIWHKCRFLLGILAALSWGSALAQQKSVYIIPFVNQNHDKTSQYLSVSIPEALLGALKQTGRFRLVNPLSLLGQEVHDELFYQDLLEPTFHENEAVRRAGLVGANIVVIGLFVTQGERVQIQAKALESTTAKILVSRTTTAVLDNSIFDVIERLAQAMSQDMVRQAPKARAGALAEEDSEEIVRKKALFGNYQFHLLGQGFLPQGKPRPFLQTGYGGVMDFQLSVWKRWLRPYLGLSATHFLGKKSVETMWLYEVSLGLSYRFVLLFDDFFLRALCLTPFVAGGNSFGTIQRLEIEPKSHNYHLPHIKGGMLFDFLFTQRISLALGISISYIIEERTPLWGPTLWTGLGYRL
ncbi:MAG: hypothetical protein NZM25_09200 [Leptospiraceae bacterium]|nr:hypothetical protein [Leptospiraceae bacterium]MDW8307316.1 hypothetical protein [Leptospiraceae bacterium]